MLLHGHLVWAVSGQMSHFLAAEAASFFEKFGLLLIAKPARFNGVDFHGVQVLSFLLFGGFHASEAVLAGGDVLC